MAPFLLIYFEIFQGVVPIRSSIIFSDERKTEWKHFCIGNPIIDVIIVSVHSISGAEKKKLCLGKISSSVFNQNSNIRCVRFSV